jgi:FkbM family methyltransferase
LSGAQEARGGGVAQMFLRYAAPLSGLRRWPIVGPLVGWASGKLMPRGELVWAQVQEGPAKGLWLQLNPRTGHGYFEGLVEPAVQSALRTYLRPGMTFYDIGANIGFFSLLAARLVGPEGRVVAFEADPEVAARLREHIVRNGCAQIDARQQAMWSHATKVTFARTDPARSPDRGLGHVAPDAEAGGIQVEAVSLDDLMGSEAPPDFLKCDVEGAEVEVFRGAQRLLNEKRPGILCEMHSEENSRALLAEFARCRYACKTIDAHHVLALPQ